MMGKVWTVEYHDWDDGWLDSIWSTEFLAEKRMEAIMKTFKNKCRVRHKGPLTKEKCKKYHGLLYEDPDRYEVFECDVDPNPAEFE